MKKIIVLGGLLCMTKMHIAEMHAQGILQFKSGFEANAICNGNSIRGIDLSAPSGVNNWDQLPNYLDWLETLMYYSQGGDMAIVTDPLNPNNRVLRLRTLTKVGNLSRSQYALWQAKSWSDFGGENRFVQQFYRCRWYLPPELGTVFSYAENSKSPYWYWYMIWESHAWEEENTRHGIYIDKKSNRNHWYFSVVQQRPEGTTVWQNTNAQQEIAVPFGQWFTIEIFFKYHETDGAFYVAITTQDNGRQVIADYKGKTKYDTRLFNQEIFKLYHDHKYLDLLWSKGLTGSYQLYDDFEIWSDYPPGYHGNSSPTVSLTSPVNNSTHTAPATVNLAATATDSDGSITRVEFWRGTTLLNADTDSPYVYSWAGVAAGSYALRAIAYDNQGATSTSTVVNIMVYSSGTPVNQPPTVSLTSPLTGSTYTAPGNITLTATATDPDGSIANVRFYRGTTLLATDTASPYEYTWTGVSSGTYHLYATATDNRGATSTSTIITVTVLSSNTPAVWYTLTTAVNPANGGTVNPASGTYLAGSQIQVTAAPNPSYTFTHWSGDITGTNPTITITMDSNKSITANFTYVPSANSTPTVSITSPSDGATFTAPANISIRATATDTDGTVTVVRFYSGTTVLGTDSTSPYEYTWTNVPPGICVLTAQAVDNGGAVGISPAVTVTVNPGTQPQQSQPELQPGEVRIVGGQDGYINATVNPNVVIRFRAKKDGQVTVRIYDLRGRLVFEQSKDGVAGIGDDIAWNAADLPAGVYIVRVKGGGMETSKRVVALR